MSEVLVRYTAAIRGEDGVAYIPQACGGVANDGLWEGWIEFVSPTRAVHTARETEQPNRDALMYWAQGLSAAYLEGAFARATAERIVVTHEVDAQPVFDGPAPRTVPRAFSPHRAVLNPFTTFDEGEELLRGQLAALSRDNLVKIIEDYQLGIPVAREASKAALADAIVGAVRARSRAA